MTDIDDFLAFAETVIHQQTGTYCSDLQRLILITALQAKRVTYDQLADDCGYSAKYIKQDVAPKLWLLLSAAFGEKVTKANIRAVLESRLRAEAVSKATYPADSSTLSKPTLETSTGATANILIVDDQPKNLRLLSDLLEEQGYEVHQAINGPVALEAIALDLPDLILLDIHMPEMDGYAVCGHLKENPVTRGIPVIFISAMSEAWDKVKAFSVGGVDYITKPFKVVEVLARVESQLSVVRLQRELQMKNAALEKALDELKTLQSKAPQSSSKEGQESGSDRKLRVV